MPDAFIPLAEETGLICELGRQVLLAACAQTRAWQLEFRQAAPLYVSVNVSPQQLHHYRLREHVAEALDRSGLAAESLILEITETAMMHDIDATIPKLHELRSLGVKLAVDDFGTGYSSLSYLQRFPVDILKIDQAIVACIESNEDESCLAKAIVSLARALGLQAIAEGVETDIQAAALAAFGCGLAQGFHFSRPVDPGAIVAILREDRTCAPHEALLV
jgi:EAL domain-containing protein (putative c-di-GMP-specific phosphodiesterase class I)